MTAYASGGASSAEYLYAKAHTINGSIDGALTDYQIRLVIHSDGGNDSGQDVYLGNRSMSWPYDIRFNDSANNALSYWIEEFTNNTSVVWVKVGYIPKSPDNTTITLLYGKVGDTDGSDAARTFLAFKGPADAPYYDTVNVGYDNISYQASARRTSLSYGNWSYGLKSPDNSDYINITFNNTTRRGVAKNGESGVKSMFVTGTFMQWTWLFGSRYTLGTYSFPWDGSGKVYISADAAGLSNTWARDGIDVSTPNGTLSFTGSINIGKPDITSICRPGINRITVTVWAFPGSWLIGPGDMYIYTTGNLGEVSVPRAGVPEVGEWQDLVFTRSGGVARYYNNTNEIGSLSSSLPDEDLRMNFIIDGGTAEQAYSFVRKYTLHEPAHGSWSSSAMPDLSISSSDITFEKVA